MEKLEISNSPPFHALIDLIKSLRGDTGCPWDKEQTTESISRYLIEEAHELSEAIATGRPEEVCGELGDVLFQIFFLAHLYNEAGQFNLSDVIQRNVEKMVRRHPHVFGNRQLENSEEIRAQWHQIKRQEKEGKAQTSRSESVLDSIPTGLPPLMRAYRVSERAAASGFDWDNVAEVMEKVEEEWGEFKAALDILESDQPDETDGREQNDVRLEFGDLIFTLVNVARFSRFHPDTAVAAAIRKFEKRFRWMEHSLALNGRSLEDAERVELEDLWVLAKKKEISDD